MALDAMTGEDKAKLKHVIEEGLKVTQEIDDLKGGLKDTVKAVADELNIKPAVINKAIRAAFKSGSIDEEKETMDEVEEVLHLVGRR